MVVLGERARSATGVSERKFSGRDLRGSVPLETRVVLRLSVGRDEAPETEMGGDCVAESVAESVTAVVVSTCGAASTTPVRARVTRYTKERRGRRVVSCVCARDGGASSDVDWFPRRWYFPVTRAVAHEPRRT